MTQTQITFTSEQRQAIEHVGRPLFLIGGPGTGKTAVVIDRARWLIEQGHASAFGTLIVAFGVRAARELQGRLHEVLPVDQAAKVHVKTIAAWCLDLLSTHGDLVGYRLTGNGMRLRVLDEGDSRELMGIALRAVTDACISGDDQMGTRMIRRMVLTDIASAISRAKHAGIGPDQYLSRPEQADPGERVVAAIYRAYQAQLKLRNALDFGDLILQTDMLFREHDEAREFARSIYVNVLVDEFQDVTGVEWRILSNAMDKGALVTVAGDVDQAIHTWRGAMGLRCEQAFRERFPDAVTLCLSENHRSGANIVRVAGTLITPERRQTARQQVGQPVLIVRANSEHDEADLVADALGALVRGGFATYGDCAVMCRTNAQIETIERALVQAAVPYRVLGRGTFFQRPEIRRVLGYLALVIDPLDDYALRRVAHLHLSKKQQAALRGDDPELCFEHLIVDGLADEALAAKVSALHLLVAQLGDLGEINLKPRDAIDRVLTILSSASSASSAKHNRTQPALQRHAERRAGQQTLLMESGAEEADEADGADESAPSDASDVSDASNDERQREDLRLLRTLAEPCATVAKFLTEVEAWDGQDPTSDVGHDQAVVMTLHDAKGLEFPVALLVGANEGVLPHYNAVAPASIEDEKRLMYVGITRAQKVAGVVWARERGGRPAQPSRFMQAWPRDAVRSVGRSQVVEVFHELE